MKRLVVVLFVAALAATFGPVNRSKTEKSLRRVVTAPVFQTGAPVQIIGASALMGELRVVNIAKPVASLQLGWAIAPLARGFTWLKKLYIS